jgi:hypothetical protein
MMAQFALEVSIVECASDPVLELLPLTQRPIATCIVMVTAQNCKFEKDDAY